MFRIASCIFVVATLSGCLVHSKTVVEGEPVATPNKLDGVYELVSESTELTEPRKTSYAALSSDWGWNLAVPERLLQLNNDQTEKRYFFLRES